MIIEDVDALKSWLAKLLEPICDADPTALANYVVALVKKDKPEKELKAFCADQLDVFLQKETTGFVDKLFECLNTRNYLRPQETTKQETKPIAQEEANKEEWNKIQQRHACHLQGGPEQDGVGCEGSLRQDRIAPRHTFHLQGGPGQDGGGGGVGSLKEWHSQLRPLNSSGGGGSSLKERHTELRQLNSSGVGGGSSLKDTYEEERDGRKKNHYSPQRNRPDTCEIRQRDKKRDDVKRRDYDRHLRNDSYRDKYDWRRGRSRSRSRSLSRSKSRGSSRSRSRSRGRSKDGDQSRSREHRGSRFEPERNESEGPYIPVSVPSSNTPQQYSSAGQTIPNTVTSEASALHPDSTTENWASFYNNQNQSNSFSRSTAPKRRCRDYDEKGFCVLGELCAFDHGSDPLVVDEVALPKMIPFPPPPPGLPPPGLLMPPMTGPPPNMRMPPGHGQPPPPGVLPLSGPPLSQTSMINNLEHSRTNAVRSLAPVGIRQPSPLPQHLQYTVSENTYEPDGYNPESPGITAVGRPPYRPFFPRSQSQQRPNLIGLTSGDMDIPPRAANIVIQTEPAAPVTTNSSISRVVIEPDNRKRSMNSIDGPPLKKSWMENSHLRPGFINQINHGFPKRNTYTNTKLEVRKIPPELNNITKLNEHFSKFGTIVNIQVAFGGDPEGALIQYTANEEARRAISSTEAVLNNRFIRVLWHRDEQHQKASTPQVPATPVLTTSTPKVHKSQSPGSYAISKVSVKQRLGVSVLSQADTARSTVNQIVSSVNSSQTFPTQTSLTKAVYGSSNLKATSKSVTVAKPSEAQEALKKKQETLKLQQDMRKTKQEMLEKQIEWQKKLISKLEKNKNMKPEERAENMKTLKELAVKISQLKDDLKPSSSVPAAQSKPKSKTEAQKELLDAELDFHKRMTSGEDTTELRKRLNQLQVEAARLGILPGGRGKTVQCRGRTRGRGRSVRGRATLTHMVVDHRPRKLTVSGFTEDEKDELLSHFSKFGEVEDLQVEDSPLSAVMTFKTRIEAESVANLAARFKGRTLQISWYKPKAPSVSTEPEEEETKEEETDTTDLFLHEDDDDEEDEDESRSWRR